MAVSEIASATSSLLGDTTPALTSTLNKRILDLIFNNSALLLKKPELLSNSGLLGKIMAFSSDFLGKSALPILGFTYQTPTSLEYLKYTYSEYPFLNQKIITNGFIKEPTIIQITALRPITMSNTWTLNYFNSKSIIELLEAYCDMGGLFKLLTRWGSIDDLALINLTLNANPEDANNPGVFVMTFKKLIFIESEDDITTNIVFDMIEKGAGITAASVAVVDGISSVLGDLL